ncbi:MAG: hypothetical protein RLZZ276_190 [Pseudomonadota bacterium]|jgi:Spx/MgsR family transcriptional regulator
MRVVIHGIRNCGTMKKAFDWLDAEGVSYEFHDYKVAGLDRPKLAGWVSRLGWEALINRSGMTFRKLDEASKRDLTEAKAMSLMLAQPGMVRRPVLAAGDELLVGFDPARYAAAFARRRR